MANQGSNGFEEADFTQSLTLKPLLSPRALHLGIDTSLTWSSPGVSVQVAAKNMAAHAKA